MGRSITKVILTFFLAVIFVTTSFASTKNSKKTSNPQYVQKLDLYTISGYFDLYDSNDSTITVKMFDDTMVDVFLTKDTFFYIQTPTTFYSGSISDLIRGDKITVTVDADLTVKDVVIYK